MMSAVERFLKALKYRCTISRRPQSADELGELEFAEAQVVAENVPCAISSIGASDDVLAIGPVERQPYRLLVPDETDIQRGDIVTIEGVDGVFVVSDPPTRFHHYGGGHHKEALIELRVS